MNDDWDDARVRAAAEEIVGNGRGILVNFGSRDTDSLFKAKYFHYATAAQPLGPNVVVDMLSDGEEQ